MSRRRSRSLVTRDPKSPYWQIDFTVHGRRFRESTQTDDRQKAETIAARRLAQAQDDADPLTPRRTLTLTAALARHWLEHAQYLRSADTLKGIGRRLLSELDAATPLIAIDDDRVARYVAARRQAVSPSTVNRELALLRAVMRRAGDLWNVRTARPAWRRHRLKEPPPRDRWLTPLELERLLAAAAPHIQPVILFAVCTGARSAAILALDWADVDLVRATVTIDVGKTAYASARRLSLPLVPRLADELARLAADAGDGDQAPIGPVFTRRGKRLRSIKKAFAGALERAEIERFRFHDLRHTAGSWLVQNGAPLDLVQEILGHATITTTKRYAHHDDRAARDAMQRAFAPANSDDSLVGKRSETDETSETVPG